jgi:cytoskeletal protein RodZ
VIESKRIVVSMKAYIVQYNELLAAMTAPCLAEVTDVLPSRNEVLDSSSESSANLTREGLSDSMNPIANSVSRVVPMVKTG